MALLSTSSNILAISLNRFIICVNKSNNYEEEFVVNLPDVNTEDNTRHAVPDTHPKSDDEPNKDDDEDIVASKTSQSKIDNISFSPNGSLLAVTTSLDKKVLLFKIDKNAAPELCSSRNLQRASSAITFSPNSKTLLVADKTGDCFEFDCEDDKAPGKWILGHMSIVLDVLFSANSKFIITSDRDEKIRVTNFPECHNIESYCMGHLEYVSAVCLLPSKNEVILSVSGDKTLRFWNMLSGVELHLKELPGPGFSMAIRKVDDNTSHLAVVILPMNKLACFKIKAIGDDITVDLLSDHSFDGSSIISLLFDDENLYLSVHSEQNQVSIQKGVLLNGKYEISPIEELNQVISKHIEENTTVVEFEQNTDILFKKKFDNMKEYQDRKKRRIEGAKCI